MTPMLGLRALLLGCTILAWQLTRTEADNRVNANCERPLRTSAPVQDFDWSRFRHQRP